MYLPAPPTKPRCRHSHQQTLSGSAKKRKPNNATTFIDPTRISIIFHCAVAKLASAEHDHHYFRNFLGLRCGSQAPCCGCCHKVPLRHWHGLLRRSQCQGLEPPRGPVARRPNPIVILGQKPLTLTQSHPRSAIVIGMSTLRAFANPQRWFHLRSRARNPTISSRASRTSSCARK